MKVRITGYKEYIIISAKKAENRFEKIMSITVLFL